MFPHPIKDLSGLRVGHLKVVPIYTKRWLARGSRIFWLCRCRCGAFVFVAAGNLVNHHSKSCGCAVGRRPRPLDVAGMLALAGAPRRDRFRHGRYRSHEYTCWQAMLYRCRLDPNYADRGITVCERWACFEAFFADMGEAPSPAHELDRRDNDGPYEPGNVRWATRSQNNRNKRTNRRLTHAGETLTLVEWTERTGLDPSLINKRLKQGWTVAEALSTPAG